MNPPNTVDSAPSSSSGAGQRTIRAPATILKSKYTAAAHFVAESRFRLIKPEPVTSSNVHSATTALVSSSVPKNSIKTRSHQLQPNGERDELFSSTSVQPPARPTVPTETQHITFRPTAEHPHPSNLRDHHTTTSATTSVPRFGASGLRQPQTKQSALAALRAPQTVVKSRPTSSSMAATTRKPMPPPNTSTTSRLASLKNVPFRPPVATPSAVPFVMPRDSIALTQEKKSVKQQQPTRLQAPSPTSPVSSNNLALIQEKQPAPEGGQTRHFTRSILKHAASPPVSSSTSDKRTGAPAKLSNDQPIQPLDWVAIENDVGQIQNLIQQLVGLLQASQSKNSMDHETRLLEENEKLKHENEKLRKELDVLKSKMSDMDEPGRSCPVRPSVYLSPMS